MHFDSSVVTHIKKKFWAPKQPFKNKNKQTKHTHTHKTQKKTKTKKLHQQSRANCFIKTVGLFWKVCHFTGVISSWTVNTHSQFLRARTSGFCISPKPSHCAAWAAEASQSQPLSSGILSLVFTFLPPRHLLQAWSKKTIFLDRGGAFFAQCTQVVVFPEQNLQTSSKGPQQHYSQ